MKKIREAMRLRFECGCNHRVIAQSINVSVSTVSECLKRIKEAKLSWPLPDDLTDGELEAKLYHPPFKKVGEKKQWEVDWAHVNKELKRKSVTLRLLWLEYKEKEPHGISYSRFCQAYRDWHKHLEVWMRQPHKAGEKLFVDYAGQTMPIADPNTGEITQAEIFVSTFGASSFIFSEATWTQTLPDWIQSHINAFEFFEGCPAIVVPDNLKSGVKKAHRYEPEINPTYQDMATHYGVAIIPARAYSPKDKDQVVYCTLL